MISTLFTIILSVLGISFLIFIHELGHYFMARKEGITVEVFSIGFGKPMIEWERNGVKWKICWILFGGYVKMAGMEKTGALEPYQIEGGFFGAKPWSRIKVAAMGPIVNIAFAFVAFTFLWAIGGREQSFSDFTSYIGWIKQDSGLYQEGIRPGDQITSFNGHPFTGFKDLVYQAVLEDKAMMMSGQEIDYLTQEKIPFTYTFSDERSTDGVQQGEAITQVMTPAEYLIYDRMPNGAPNELLPGSPLKESGIAYGDRIIWVDGALVFSQHQLREVVNAPKVLLTIERDGKILSTRIPRMQIRDLRLGNFEKDELDDWTDSAGLKIRVEDVMFIPYSLSTDGVVKKPFRYIDEASQAKELFESEERIPSEEPLIPGDKIIAVQGIKVNRGIEVLKELQTRKILIIVKRMKKKLPLSWKEVDQGFETGFDVADIKKIVHSFGTNNMISDSGELSLLKPITPVPMNEFPLNEEQSKLREEKLEKFEKKIDRIKDSKQKAAAEKVFENYKKQLKLGVVLQDKTVNYNPQPFVLFGEIFRDTYRNLIALFTGFVSPKHLSGPVGIIQVIQKSWTVGAKEALYWLSFISLNLGIINLLPIPMLDGGHICFSLWEMATKKPLKAKTMERLIWPFVLLLIAFFVYLTYHDIVRLISQFF